MMFARKFSTKKTAALLDKVDSYILLNESTDAGLSWPGFFDVDIKSPGKTWKSSFRKKKGVRTKKFSRSGKSGKRARGKGLVS